MFDCLPFLNSFSAFPTSVMVVSVVAFWWDSFNRSGLQSSEITRNV